MPVLKTSFYVNADIPLNSLKFQKQVTGDWKESHERLIELSDHDPETVSRLLDWLDSRDYKSPFPDDVSRGTKSDEHVSDLTDTAETLSAYQMNKTTDDSILGRFRRLVPPASSRRTEAEKYEQWSQRSSSNHSHVAAGFDFEPTLMCHAKLYLLADYSCIQDLKNLRYQCLGTALLHMSKFLPDACITKNVATLAGLVYANTPQKKRSLEPLRNLISSFVAAHSSELDGASMDDLIQKGGDFAVDLIKKLGENVTQLHHSE